MMSVMTVEIVSLSNNLTTGGTAVCRGTLKFSNYSKDGETKTNLSYEGYGAAAVSLMDAGVYSNGIAIGYVDIIDQTPVFKINSFIHTGLPVMVAEEELAMTTPS